MHPSLKRLWPFPLLIGGGIVGYIYWPTTIGFAATMLCLGLFLPLSLVSLGDVFRAIRGQRQPDFFEANLPPPRPLFIGPIADALDSVANAASGLFGLALVLGGLGLLGYNLVLLTVTLFTHSAWFPLAGVALVTFGVWVFLWRSSAIARLTAIAVLAILSLVASPFIEKGFF